MLTHLAMTNHTKGGSDQQERHGLSHGGIGLGLEGNFGAIADNSSHFIELAIAVSRRRGAGHDDNTRFNSASLFESDAAVDSWSEFFSSLRVR